MHIFCQCHTYTNQNDINNYINLFLRISPSTIRFGSLELSSPSGSQSDEERGKLPKISIYLYLWLCILFIEMYI